MSVAPRRSSGQPLELVVAAGDGDGELEQVRARIEMLERENGQLKTALETRIVIEQAKGYLAGRFAIDTDEAFRLLRRAARNNRMSIHELAAAVVAAPPPPDAA